MYFTVRNSKNKRCPPTKHGLLNELHAKLISLIVTTLIVLLMQIRTPTTVKLQQQNTLSTIV